MKGNILLYICVVEIRTNYYILFQRLLILSVFFLVIFSTFNELKKFCFDKTESVLCIENESDNSEDEKVDDEFDKFVIKNSLSIFNFDVIFQQFEKNTKYSLNFHSQYYLNISTPPPEC